MFRYLKRYERGALYILKMFYRIISGIFPGKIFKVTGKITRNTVRKGKQ